MSKHYSVEISSDLGSEGVVLAIGFGDQATNDVLVKEAVSDIQNLNLSGGKAVYLNGPASLPVAVSMAHEVSHLFGAVFCFDPKMGGYVCAVSHTPDIEVGDFQAQ